MGINLPIMSFPASSTPLLSSVPFHVLLVCHFIYTYLFHDNIYLTHRTDRFVLENNGKQAYLSIGFKNTFHYHLFRKSVNPSCR